MSMRAEGVISLGRIAERDGSLRPLGGASGTLGFLFQPRMHRLRPAQPLKAVETSNANHRPSGLDERICAYRVVEMKKLQGIDIKTSALCTCTDDGQNPSSSKRLDCEDHPWRLSETIQSDLAIVTLHRHVLWCARKC
jgi:hypothetical protein